MSQNPSQKLPLLPLPMKPRPIVAPRDQPQPQRVPNISPNVSFQPRIPYPQQSLQIAKPPMPIPQMQPKNSIPIQKDTNPPTQKRKETPTPEPVQQKRITPVTTKKEKGLRHFAVKVCERVQIRGKTTYVDVANDLVAEFLDTSGSLLEQKTEEKNIRRRVYDALNVLMALNIIEKGKKEISWKGLVDQRNDMSGIYTQKQIMYEQLAAKRQLLNDLMNHREDLVKLNKRNESAQHMAPSERVELPFILVNTHRESDIDCEITPTETRLFLNFNLPFEIQDDHGVIRKIVQ